MSANSLHEGYSDVYLYGNYGASPEVELENCLSWECQWVLGQQVGGLTGDRWYHIKSKYSIEHKNDTDELLLYGDERDAKISQVQLIDEDSRYCGADWMFEPVGPGGSYYWIKNANNEYLLGDGRPSIAKAMEVYMMKENSGADYYEVRWVLEKV